METNQSKVAFPQEQRKGSKTYRSGLMRDIKSKILKQLSQYHRDQLIKHSHQFKDLGSSASDPHSKPPAYLKSMYFFVDSIKHQTVCQSQQRNYHSQHHNQKQAISKKINDMKGMTRLRYVPDQTDFIVVDQEFFNSTNSGANTDRGGINNSSTASFQQVTTWADSEFITKDLAQFLQVESQSIFEQAQKMLNDSELNQQRYEPNIDNQALDNLQDQLQFTSLQNPAQICSHSQQGMQKSNSYSKMAKLQPNCQQQQNAQNNLDEAQTRKVKDMKMKAQQSAAMGNLAPNGQIMNNDQQIQMRKNQLVQNNQMNQQKRLTKLQEYIEIRIDKETRSNYQQFMRQTDGKSQSDIGYSYMREQNSKIQSKIIDVKDLDYALECMMSNTVKWYQDRSVTLYCDFPKVQYNQEQYFIISRVNFNSELNSKNISRIAKQNILNSLGEHEKQAYHQFDAIKQETRTKEYNQQHGLISEEQKYEVYRLYMDGIKGIDPCMTFEERIHRQNSSKESIETFYHKKNRRDAILLGSETEGVQHENIPMNEIPLPRPQSYHTYCQICNLQYDSFDEHIQTESHLKRAKNQAQIVLIDELIIEMNEQKKWVHKWPPEKPKQKEPVKFRIDKNRKIHPVPKERTDKTNVASRMTMNMLQSTGRRSGRASATGVKDPGKVSKVSRNSTKRQVSAKSSVSRPQKGNFIQHQYQNVAQYQEHKYQSPSKNIGLNQQNASMTQSAQKHQSKRQQMLLDSHSKNDSARKAAVEPKVAVDQAMQPQTQAEQDSCCKAPVLEKLDVNQLSEEQPQPTRFQNRNVTPYYPRDINKGVGLDPGRIPQPNFDEIEEVGDESSGKKSEVAEEVAQDKQVDEVNEEMEEEDEEYNSNDADEEGEEEQEFESGEDSANSNKNPIENVIDLSDECNIMKHEQQYYRQLHETEAPKKLEQVPATDQQTSYIQNQHSEESDKSSGLTSSRNELGKSSKSNSLSDADEQDQENMKLTMTLRSQNKDGLRKQSAEVEKQFDSIGQECELVSKFEGEEDHYESKEQMNSSEEDSSSSDESDQEVPSAKNDFESDQQPNQEETYPENDLVSVDLSEAKRENCCIIAHAGNDQVNYESIGQSQDEKACITINSSINIIENQKSQPFKENEPGSLDQDKIMSVAEKLVSYSQQASTNPKNKPNDTDEILISESVQTIEQPNCDNSKIQKDDQVKSIEEIHSSNQAKTWIQKDCKDNLNFNSFEDEDSLRIIDAKETKQAVYENFRPQQNVEIKQNQKEKVDQYQIKIIEKQNEQSPLNFRVNKSTREQSSSYKQVMMQPTVAAVPGQSEKQKQEQKRILQTSSKLPAFSHRSHHPPKQHILHSQNQMRTISTDDFPNQKQNPIKRTLDRVPEPQNYPDYGGAMNGAPANSLLHANKSHLNQGQNVVFNSRMGQHKNANTNHSISIFSQSTQGQNQIQTQRPQLPRPMAMYQQSQGGMSNGGIYSQSNKSVTFRQSRSSLSPSYNGGVSATRAPQVVKQNDQDIKGLFNLTTGKKGLNRRACLVGGSATQRNAPKISVSRQGHVSSKQSNVGGHISQGQPYRGPSPSRQAIAQTHNMERKIVQANKQYNIQTYQQCQSSQSTKITRRNQQQQPALGHKRRYNDLAQSQQNQQFIQDYQSQQNRGLQQPNKRLKQELAYDRRLGR